MFTGKQTPDSHVLFLGVECAPFRCEGGGFSLRTIDAAGLATE